MGWIHFNDRLALLLLVAIPVLWALSGRGIITLPPEVTGALIVTWTMVVQYYFRRAPPNVTEGPPAPKPPGA